MAIFFKKKLKIECGVVDHLADDKSCGDSNDGQGALACQNKAVP